MQETIRDESLSSFEAKTGSGLDTMNQQSGSAQEGVLSGEADVQSRIESIRRYLAEKIGRQRYEMWFESSTKFKFCGPSDPTLQRHGKDSGVYLRIAVPNSFMASWIENHFLKEIDQAVLSVTGIKQKASFTIDPELGASARSAADAGRRTGYPEHVLHKRKDKSTCLSRCSRAEELSLETFVAGPSNELAFNASRQVARDSCGNGITGGRGPTFNPLFIHGGYGLGKTHLLRGICNEVAKNTEKGREVSWLYLSAEDFVNQFVLALKTKKLEGFRRRLRQTDLLVIDDIHFLASKPSTQEEFLHTFNTINLAGKQIVLASDAHPRQISQLSEKLINRFVAGMVVEIRQPDFQTRCEICRRFLQNRLSGPYNSMKQAGINTNFGSCSTPVPEGVITYVAENLRSSVRELQGALLKLIAYSSLQNEKITLSMAQIVLAAHLERCDPMVHVCDIEAAVADFFGVTVAGVHSSRKDKTVSLARHFSMYLIRKHIKMSFCEIGRLLGNKNHATVLMGCRNIERSLAQNAELHWRTSAGNKVDRAQPVLNHLELSLKSRA